MPEKNIEYAILSFRKIVIIVIIILIVVSFFVTLAAVAFGINAMFQGHGLTEMLVFGLAGLLTCLWVGYCIFLSIHELNKKQRARNEQNIRPGVNNHED